MKRIFYLAVIAGSVISSCTQEQQAPNILFVFADQLRSHELSSYGGENIQTPNLDRLAREGVRITNALSTYPICSPYRAMLISGLYPMRNGMTNNDHPYRPELTSFAEACNQAGYQTAYIGKWHLDGHGRTAYIPPERREGFQFFQALECTHNYFESAYYDNDSEELTYWDDYDALSQTKAAQSYIQNRNKDQPFFLMLSWGPPHDPYIAPEEYLEQVDAATLKLRPNVSERKEAAKLLENPRFTLPVRYQKTRIKYQGHLADTAFIREMNAGYLASTMALDDYMDDLLKTLEEEEILDHTIVVFTSDHGDHLGSHGIWGKDTPFEESISIPLIIRYPEKIPASTVSDVLFTPIDVMPTILGMAGVEWSEVDGSDLSRVLVKKAPDTRDAALIMGMSHFCNASVINGMDTWRGVRTKKYTYARYEDQTAWLLYDNEEDPYQMNNLAEDPAYAGLIADLNGKLDQLLSEAGDAENTQKLYDKIIKENPQRTMLLDIREVNAGL